MAYLGHKIVKNNAHAAKHIADVVNQIGRIAMECLKDHEMKKNTSIWVISEKARKHNEQLHATHADTCYSARAAETLLERAKWGKKNGQ